MIRCLPRPVWSLACLGLAFLSALAWPASSPLQAATATNHPRLFFTTEDLPRLRSDRFNGWRARIWTNLAASADWCLQRRPRAGWIAPATPDPRYENLYDRFYAIMGDLAITEHLGFAYALSGQPRYGDAARDWVLASCRAWQREADAQPDSGKAYAVSRLLKGIAVGYDLVWDRLSPAEREEIRGILGRIGRRYFEHWFNTPTISSAGYHTHHAVVEWGSFGVLALALLGEVPDAETWLAATTRKFREDLLPRGLAPDGTQTEGATFWASTMHYRLFFMDALRRVTREDLFARFGPEMNAELALASVACRKKPGLDEHQANVLLEPAYGQLDYYAPVLLALAREYRRPRYQWLAAWDESLGALQRTRYVTPRGEELIFELGGYAYAWCDETVPARPEPGPLSWHFPHVNEGYVRRSWRPRDLLAGVRQGLVSVHAGGVPVFIELGPGTNAATNAVAVVLEENGRRAVLRAGPAERPVLRVELDRRQGRLWIERYGREPVRFWMQGAPEQSKGTVRWPGGATVSVRTGRLKEWQATGYESRLSVGNGLLPLNDPLARSYPAASIEPGPDGKVRLEIRLRAQPAAE